MTSIQDISQLLAKRRKELGMEQADMYMRIGMKQQQYQRVESGNDMKLSTLLRVLEGLNLELSITPKQSKVSTPANNSVPQSEPGTLEDDKEDLEFWFGKEDNQ
ncbi:helix-turn-helix domain-containing protein [Aliidiomarina soli]|uniref:Transcriptional regulator n=1 Tax=Aliidiomarina soli TaxID=1928574 RepID=A0A432WDX3_9GAMM|nr:helix-turn-helix domain-containing protein [Aliidiomarina soli]RUO31087.1 transcriptional regulator [Aliidiomarina soli]